MQNYSYLSMSLKAVVILNYWKVGKKIILAEKNAHKFNDHIYVHATV
jgi:hypothetical protein